MTDNSELARAVREEREAEKRWAACRRRVNELAGISEQSSQRKKKSSRPDDFARACGL